MALNSLGIATDGLIRTGGATSLYIAARGYLGAGVSVVVSPAVTRTFWPGYIPPKRKKKREKPVEVEVAVQDAVIHYIEVRPPVVTSSVAPVMEAVDKLALLIETRAKHVDIQRKIEELREEEDIIIILSQIQ